MHGGSISFVQASYNNLRYYRRSSVNYEGMQAPGRLLFSGETGASGQVIRPEAVHKQCKTGNCLITFIPHFVSNMLGFFLVPVIFA